MDIWQCYRGNGEHTGSISGKGPLKGNLFWSSHDNGNITTLALINNTLYFTTDMEFYALNAFTGNLLWKKNFPEKIHHPVISGNTIYLASENGIIYALDVEKGNEKWSYKTDNSIKTSPVIWENSIFTGSADRKLYNIDISTGELKWFFQSEEPVEASPVIFDNILFFGGGRILYAIDALKGRERWSYKTKIDIVSCPTVSDGIIYFSSHYIYALDVINGAKKWITEIEGNNVTGSITVSKGAVFVPSSVYMSELDRKAGVIYCLDGITGSREWAFFSWDNVSLPAVAEYYVYFASGDGKVYALDGRNGLQKWVFETGDTSFISPVAGHGYMYIANDRGTIYAFE